MRPCKVGNNKNPAAANANGMTWRINTPMTPHAASCQQPHATEAQYHGR